MGTAKRTHARAIGRAGFHLETPRRRTRKAGRSWWKCWSWGRWRSGRVESEVDSHVAVGAEVLLKSSLIPATGLDPTGSVGVESLRCEQIDRYCQGRWRTRQIARGE